MDIFTSTPNFDYYDIYNHQFDITNNLSPPYQMISNLGMSSSSSSSASSSSLAAVSAISSSTLSSSSVVSSSLGGLSLMFHHNDDHHESILTNPIYQQYELGVTSKITTNTDNNDGNAKIRNAVDPNLAFWAVVDGVLLVFILGGNFLTIIAVRFSRRLRSITSNLFVLSLAISDILVGFTLPYHLAFYMGSGLGKTKELCLLRFFLIILACCNSIWNLIAIAVDRYIAIFFPLHYTRYMTKKVAIFLLGFGWIVGITFATIPLIWNNWDTAVQCEFDEILKPWYLAGVMTPGFAMVWVCMLIVYLRIWREATKHAKQLRSSFTGLHETPSDSKSIQVVLFILGCFSICWLPYFIIACVQIFKYVDMSTPMLYKAAFSLAMANSGMNPIIYAWKNTGFRRAFSRLLRCQSPDYNDVSQHSIRSLNKRRKSSASQSNQSKSGKADNLSTKFRSNEAITVALPSLKQQQQNSITITVNANPNMNHNGFTLHSSNKNSSDPMISNGTEMINSDKFYHQNKFKPNSIQNEPGGGNKTRKSSLKRAESSDDDRTSTPHGVFPRKTSFGTVTTTIINTSTDDDDGDYDYTYHRIGYDNLTNGIGGKINSITGGGHLHHNVLMSTIVSLDDISLVATSNNKSTSSHSVSLADNNSVISIMDTYQKQIEEKNEQQQNQQQQQQKLTKCIASIKDVNELSKISKNNIGKGCNSNGGGSYREGFIIEYDGNGNDTTKCVCVLNPKELKQKLSHIHDWSSGSTSSITSNLSNISSSAGSYNGIQIQNDVKKINLKNKRIIKTIENPIENISSNIDKKDFNLTSVVVTKTSENIENSKISKKNNSSSSSSRKSDAQKLCNSNNMINCKNNQNKYNKNNVIV